MVARVSGGGNIPGRGSNRGGGSLWADRKPMIIFLGIVILVAILFTIFLVTH